MNTIHSSPIQTGKGYIIRLAALVLGAVFFLSAAASTAKANTMTQLEYLQFLVALSGEDLGPNPTPQDYVNWALSRGLRPDGGWQPEAQLAKQVVAQTVAQMLNIIPRKNVGNYVALLAQNGVHVPNANLIDRTDLTDFIDTGLAGWLASFGGVSPSDARVTAAPADVGGSAGTGTKSGHPGGGRR
jgi:hypothetical protein